MNRNTEADGLQILPDEPVKKDEKYFEIRITKATLFLTEHEIMTGLTPDTLIKGLQRGKAIKRRRQFESRHVARS